MARVIVLDPIAQEGLDRLARAEGIEYQVCTGLKGDALREALSQFDAAICRSGVKITAEVLQGNKRLRAIVRAGVGTDNIDREAATRCGIVVMNTPAGNTLSTAEHTLALMMALSRNIAPAYASLQQGKWERNKYMGTQLAGKTLGVLGLGRIGQAVAARAKALQMRVLGYDPFFTEDKVRELGLEPVPSVQQMLPEVDYLTVHTPLTPETRHLIGAAEIEQMKPGVRLINCARGGIYDEQALLEGLKSKKLGGVALDVFENEPCTSSPLFGLPNVVCTPHLGASTEEAQVQVALEGVELILDFLTRGIVRHAVNMTPLDRQKLEGMRGYLNLAWRLGLLQAQLVREPVKSCSLLYRGDVAERDTRLLTAGFAVGWLSQALDEEVNLVNAQTLMRERGIQVVEQSRHEMGAFTSVISADVITQRGKHRAAGTLFGTEMLRLVQLDEFRLEAYLDGILLVFRHNDVPGIIGAVGTIFGRHGVNIAQMAVGRAGNVPGGEAIGVLNLDNPPPQEALDEVLQHPHITRVDVLHLPPAGELPEWLRA